MDENDNQEAPLSQTETGKEPPEQQQEGQSAAVESEARKMGWRPKEEWTGDPEKWRDASAFVERGREFEPFVAAKLKRENAALQKSLDRQRTDFERRATSLERMTRVALEHQRSAIEEKYADKKSAAVETGDRDGYDRAVTAEKAALQKLDEKTKDKAEEPKPGTLTVEEQEAYEDWQDDNTWFKADTEMTAFADRRFNRLKMTEPGTPFAELLTKVREAVEDKWPDKFRKGGKSNGTTRVEGGERTPSEGRSGGRTKWSQLPPEAKSQADALIKNDRLFLKKGETIEKNMNDARERYAASYLEQG